MTEEALHHTSCIIKISSVTDSSRKTYAVIEYSMRKYQWQRKLGLQMLISSCGGAETKTALLEHACRSSAADSLLQLHNFQCNFVHALMLQHSPLRVNFKMNNLSSMASFNICCTILEDKYDMIIII